MRGASVLVLVAGLGAVMGCGSAQVGQQSAYLTVDSTPRAAVYVDDELIGNTPQRKKAIAAGAHVVRLECVTCDQPQERTLEFSVEPREIYTHDCTVFGAGAVEGTESPATGDDTAHITVTSFPWSHVHLDGILIGNTPKIRYPVEPGDHTVVFECGSCPEPIDETISFRVDPGETWTHAVLSFGDEVPTADDAILLEGAVGPAYLSVRSEQVIEVHLDGVLIGEAPVTGRAIVPGEHELRVVCAELDQEKTLLFNVPAGEIHESSFTFEP